MESSKPREHTGRPELRAHRDGSYAAIADEVGHHSWCAQRKWNERLNRSNGIPLHFPGIRSHPSPQAANVMHFAND